MLRLLAGLCCSLLLSQAVQAQATRTVRVLTYNIHHCLGGDNKLDVERIGRVIKSVDPDVVALQEVDVKTKRSFREDQAATLARQLGMYVGFAKAIPFDEGEYGNCILSKSPIEDFQSHVLSRTEGRETRVVAVAQIPLGGDEPRINFLCTHLDHSNETVRLEQVFALNRIVGDLPRSPTILAGDLNAAPESRTMTRLRGMWTDSAPEKAGNTFSAEKPSTRIDYVLYRQAPGWKVREQRVLDESVASDHRPLLTVFEFPEPKR